MNKKTLQLSAAFVGALTISGCASVLTPTSTTEEGYVIYDVQGSGIDRSAFLKDITEVVQTHNSGVRVNRGIPPAQVPDQPGRFTIANPLKGTSLGALAGSAGANLNMAQCDGAIMTLTSDDSSMARYGESSRMAVCVYQYKKGYSVNIYVASAESTGAFSVDTLGATISRQITGGSKQFIPRTINEVRMASEKYGVVKEVDSFIPESYKGLFYNQTTAK